MGRPDSAGGAGRGELVDDFLQHYGVIGMKWGKRKAESGGRTPVKDRRGGPIRPAENGFTNAKGDLLASDAVRTRVNQAIAKKSGTDVLSTKDLQELVTRLNLEQQYDRLNPQTQSAGRAFAMGILKNAGPIAIKELGPKVVDALPGQYAMAGKLVIGLATAAASANSGKKKK